jgi:hypothetical protein
MIEAQGLTGVAGNFLGRDMFAFGKPARRKRTLRRGERPEQEAWAVIHVL